MNLFDEKFKALEAENAPGQEVRQDLSDLNSVMKGEKLEGTPVDFSHGDVDAFPPTPQSEIFWNKGFEDGAKQAYTEYRGSADIRKDLANRIADFTGKSMDADNELIITPGTQGALFLALGSTVTTGTKVAIVEPDYFANRKLVKFFGGTILPVELKFYEEETGLNLNQLEEAFKNGAEVLVFSTPNNPTGHVYSAEKIAQIGLLAAKYKATVIVDQLYSRMLYRGESYTHLRSCEVVPENIITIMGPSKTESLSGYRLGVAFGVKKIVDRMERLQAIVSLRAAGYNQAALKTWFNEPEGWLEKRIKEHEDIRDELLTIFREAGLPTASPQAGSYLFPKLPELCVSIPTFVKLLRHQAGVTVTPGTEFAPNFTNNIRLNFSQDHKAAVEAAKRIVKMVNIYKK